MCVCVCVGGWMGAHLLFYKLFSLEPDFSQESSKRAQMKIHFAKLWALEMYSLYRNDDNVSFEGKLCVSLLYRQWDELVVRMYMTCSRGMCIELHTGQLVFEIHIFMYYGKRTWVISYFVAWWFDTCLISFNILDVDKLIKIIRYKIRWFIKQ